MKETSQAATATKYVVQELGKDVKAASHYINETTTRIGVNAQNSRVLSNLNNAIPKEYKVAFGIEATTGVMVESLYYLDGSKEVNLPNLMNSGHKVGFEASYNALTHKLNPIYGVVADTVRGVGIDGGM